MATTSVNSVTDSDLRALVAIAARLSSSIDVTALKPVIESGRHAIAVRDLETRQPHLVKTCAEITELEERLRQLKIAKERARPSRLMCVVLTSCLLLIACQFATRHM